MEIGSETVEQLLERVSARVPVPGGGAVTGVVGALAAALAAMVTEYSLSSSKLESHHARHRELIEEFARARKKKSSKKKRS